MKTTKQPRNAVSRRMFLKRGALAAGSVVAVPSFIPARALGGAGAVAPSERIVLGAIGVGNRGMYDLGCFLEEPGVQFVAVCDTEEGRRRGVEKRGAGR